MPLRLVLEFAVLEPAEERLKKSVATVLVSNSLELGIFEFSSAFHLPDTRQLSAAAFGGRLGAFLLREEKNPFPGALLEILFMRPTRSAPLSLPLSFLVDGIMLCL